jgi:hypothetical protein
MEPWVHYSAYKSPLLVFFLNHLYRIYTFLPYFLKSILSVFSHLGQCLPCRHSNTLYHLLYVHIIHIICPVDPLVFDFKVLIPVEVYSRITSTKSPSFCMTTFSASLTHITASLPQTQDFLYCVSRRKLTPQPLRLQNHT